VIWAGVVCKSDYFVAGIMAKAPPPDRAAGGVCAGALVLCARLDRKGKERNFIRASNAPLRSGTKNS